MKKTQARKSLRIGIIQDGKITQERIISAGDSVSIGESAKNTFVFPKTNLIPDEFPLFLYHAKGYVLQLNDNMSGRLKMDAVGSVRNLEQVRNDPNVTRKGNVFRLSLSERDRGKIVIGSTTILFQFVPPPPLQAIRPIESMDFRPRFFEEGDSMFYAFLGVNTLFAAALVAAVATFPAYDAMVIEEIPDRFVQLIVENNQRLSPKPVHEVVKIDKKKKQTEEKKEEEAEKTPLTPEKKPDAISEARRKEQIKKEVIEDSFLIKQLLTRGEGEGSAMDLWSDADAGLDDMDAILANVTAVKVATLENTGLRKGIGLSNEEATIGELTSAGGGTATVTESPKLVIYSTVEAAEPELFDTKNPAAISKVVKSKFGQLKYCYEKALKSNPSLSGRLEIEFNIRNKNVTSIVALANSTGDKEFTDCVVKKIRRWKFPTGVEGQVIYPFIFTSDN
tara:strand:+ start:40 stop:1389 length:1350 start_codon:yes stop_codon:yes gene_type:complete